MFRIHVDLSLWAQADCRKEQSSSYASVVRSQKHKLESSVIKRASFSSKKAMSLLSLHQSPYVPFCHSLHLLCASEIEITTNRY